MHYFCGSRTARWQSPSPISLMIAPRIDSSNREERLAFIRERFRCKAPACGGCGSCHLPGGQPAIKAFEPYIEGKQEFAAVSAALWQCNL